jgi:hypothetical protein
VVENGRLFWQKQTLEVKAMHRTYQALEALADGSLDNLRWSIGQAQKHKGLIELTYEGGSYFFDRQSGLLKRTTNRSFVFPGASQEMKAEAEFTDYKKVEGLQLFTRMLGYANGRRTFEIIVSDVKLFKTFDDGEFAPPRN